MNFDILSMINFALTFGFLLFNIIEAVLSTDKQLSGKALEIPQKNRFHKLNTKLYMIFHSLKVTRFFTK